LTASDTLTGEHFFNGNIASAEGAIAAGCRFFAGYPITPSTEIAERMSRRLPQLGGTFIQMEDELASMCAILGAAWGGAKSMTATSGPGFSLMMENIGLGVMTETPTVVVNVMRGGPSTGLPTLVAQADVMQARWGSHGSCDMIALAPSSPQEMFDFTVRAFNLSERYRIPVIVLSDEVVGHMTEKVVIPPADKIDVVDRRKPSEPPGPNYLPYKAGEDLVPPMANAGEGYHMHVTGLTHDERGYPVITAAAQVKLVTRLCEKISKNKEKIIGCTETDIQGAEVVVVSYGISARTSWKAIRAAQRKGMKVGQLKLDTVWPFPEERIRKLAGSIKGFVVPELNMGQVVYEVERCAAGQCKTRLVPHPGGEIHDPAEILKAIREVSK
jgi:2-oxoglutarate ferredoxin oxidoreductase subunit alpha